MCKQVCVISAEESFQVGELFNLGRIGFFDSEESLKKKMPEKFYKNRNNGFKVMTIDVEEKFIKEKKESNLLCPRSKALITEVKPLS